MLIPLLVIATDFLKGATNKHDPNQKEMGQGAWITPSYPRPLLLDVDISLYKSLKIEVAVWLKDSTSQEEPFPRREYKSAKKKVGENLAVDSQLKVCTDNAT